jgi:cell fate (sporulation/competence/biofilm development) regulator YmcA (YheA/YmcA/DUF963 family)
MAKYPLVVLRRKVAELIEEIQTKEEKKSYQKAKTKLQETCTIKRVPGSLKKVLLRHAKSGGKSPKKRRRKNESEK